MDEREYRSEKTTDFRFVMRDGSIILQQKVLSIPVKQIQGEDNTVYFSWEDIPLVEDNV